jgi:hypothetical protein
MRFQKRKAKSVVLLRSAIQKNPRSGTTGSGAGPRKLIVTSPTALLFPEKEAKSVVLLRRNSRAIKTFREAEPRGLGLAPEN